MSRRRTEAALEADLAALLMRLKAELGPAKFAKLVARMSANEAANTAATHTDLIRTGPAKAAAPASDDTVILEVEALLSPLLARADEKAQLLLDAAMAEGGDVSDLKPKGLRPTVKRLRTRMADAAILAAAHRVMADAHAYGSQRETVV